MSYARVLRGKVLDNPGPQHRDHARRALLKLLLLRTKALGEANEPCLPGQLPMSMGERSSVAPWFDAANGGASTVPQLRQALTDQKPEGRTIRLLVAANSLALTGIMPSAEMINEMAGLIATESDANVRLELTLALAAYAQRTKDAFVVLRTLLLKEKDCGFVEAVAFNLPGEDLRYRLFHGLAKEPGTRARNIRKWIREKKFVGCRKDS